MELKDAAFEQSALYGDYYIYVFSLKNTYYRVIATAYSDIADAIWTLDRTVQGRAAADGILKSNTKAVTRTGATAFFFYFLASIRTPSARC